MIDNKLTIKRGVVVSNSMDKTILVLVKTLKTHAKYLKKVVFTKKYKVHNPNNVSYLVGDEVLFVECRPISRNKRFLVFDK